MLQICCIISKLSGCAPAVPLALLWLSCKLQSIFPDIDEATHLWWFPLLHPDSGTHCCHHTMCHGGHPMTNMTPHQKWTFSKSEWLSGFPKHPVPSQPLKRCPGSIVKSVNYNVIPVGKVLELISWTIGENLMKQRSKMIVLSAMTETRKLGEEFFTKLSFKIMSRK